jgi:uncharacterized alkaline shock family protein YloU
MISRGEVNAEEFGMATDAPSTGAVDEPRRTTTTMERADQGTTARRDDSLRSGASVAMAAQTALITDAGTTRIADSVVAKIAGLAARDIPGVHSMGTGMARRIGQLKSLVPGGGETATAGQGVAVQVGEREAAVDLDLVTWYGQSIVDISDAVRKHVIGQVEGMTGLKVVEVNIQIDDIYVESQQDQPDQTTRVQ